MEAEYCKNCTYWHNKYEALKSEHEKMVENIKKIEFNLCTGTFPGLATFRGMFPEIFPEPVKHRRFIIMDSDGKSQNFIEKDGALVIER